MTAHEDYGIPASPEEIELLCEIQADAFSFPAEMARKRVELFGRDIVRALRENGRITAGLWLVDMGQWFGGRSVPMTGVAAVAVAPEARGHGAAFTLAHLGYRREALDIVDICLRENWESMGHDLFAGVAGVGTRPPLKELYAIWPCLIPREHITQSVEILEV